MPAGPPLPRISEQGRKGREVWAACDTKIRLTKAELNYTCDVGRWQERKWEAVPARLDGTRATATLPGGARVYYLNVFDDRGCVVSTEHEDCSPP